MDCLKEQNILLIVNLYAHFVNDLRSVESRRGEDQKPYCRSGPQRACYVELDIYFIGSEYDDGSEGVSFTPAHSTETSSKFAKNVMLWYLI